MVINKYHGSYNIQSRTDTIKYIVIHYVGAGTSKSGNAKANCKYFAGANRNASAHYFVDDGGIWEYANPKSYVTWHCGDGHGAYGITNANSIGIEVCVNGDKAYTKKEINYLKQLVPYLMKTYKDKRVPIFSTRRFLVNILRIRDIPFNYIIEPLFVTRVVKPAIRFYIL